MQQIVEVSWVRDPALGSEVCRLGFVQQVRKESKGLCAGLGLDAIAPAKEA